MEFDIELKDFLADVVDSGLQHITFRYMFLAEVLRRWLADNAWIEDQLSACQHCAHLKRVSGEFDEEKCRQNVESGGTCYREVLRTVLAPLVRNALTGYAPRVRELGRAVHRSGPYWDGWPKAETTLLAIIQHELGGALMKVDAEEAGKATRMRRNNEITEE